MTEIDTTSAGGPLTILDAAEELLRLRGLREALDARVDAIKAAVLEIAKDTAKTQGAPASYPTRYGTVSMVNWAGTPQAVISVPAQFLAYLAATGRATDGKGCECATATITVKGTDLPQALETLRTWGGIAPLATSVAMTPAGAKVAKAILAPYVDSTTVDAHGKRTDHYKVVDTATGDLSSVPGTDAYLPTPRIHVKPLPGVLADLRVDAALDARGVADAYAAAIGRTPALPPAPEPDPF